jgi:hypothetical protein
MSVRYDKAWATGTGNVQAVVMVARGGDRDRRVSPVAMQHGTKIGLPGGDEAAKSGA